MHWQSTWNWMKFSIHLWVGVFFHVFNSSHDGWDHKIRGNFTGTPSSSCLWVMFSTTRCHSTGSIYFSRTISTNCSHFHHVCFLTTTQISIYSRGRKMTCAPPTGWQLVFVFFLLKWSIFSISCQNLLIFFSSVFIINLRSIVFLL